jgi:hypothetical protein
LIKMKTVVKNRLTTVIMAYGKGWPWTL